MVYATYECMTCADKEDLFTERGEQLHEHFCNYCGKLTMWNRKWTPVSIGAVQGAGGSPAR